MSKITVILAGGVAGVLMLVALKKLAPVSVTKHL